MLIQGQTKEAVSPRIGLQHCAEAPSNIIVCQGTDNSMAFTRDGETFRALAYSSCEASVFHQSG